LATYYTIKQKVMLQPISEALYAYGSDNQLNMSSCFDTEMRCAAYAAKATVYVFNTYAKCLLSGKTATDLHLLSFGGNVSNVSAENQCEFVRQFPEVFQGVGKLKRMKAKFHVDKTVTPVAQITIGVQR